MAIRRAIPVPLLAAAPAAAVLAALASCASGRLGSEPTAPVSLEGTWKLNRSVSDDPQKIIDQLRVAALKRMPRPNNAGFPAPAGSMRRTRRGAPGDTGSQVPEEPGDLDQGGPGGSGGAGDLGAGDSGPGSGGGPDSAGAPGPQGGAGPRANGGTGAPGSHPMRDPLRGTPLLHALTSTLARGDFLVVHQSPEQLALDYGGDVSTYTPGGHSVVSSEGGVADQTSGWKGKEYIIDVRPQVGPEVVERYALSEDGKHLVMKLHVAASELPAVDVTRVYDPTTEVAPRAVPSID